MKQFLFSCFICLLLGLQAQTGASLNMTFVGKKTYPNNQLSNLWGYVAPNGTEYAIVGTENGVSIVSLANPATPTEVQFIPGVQTIWREVKTYSHYAYIGNEGGDGLRIIDLAGLPGSIAYKDTIIQGVETIHTVSETDGFLYLNGTNMGGKGFDVLDLKNDPWRPQWLGRYNTRYVHDCYVRGNTMYAGQIYDGLLTLIDVTDKANPVDISTHSYPNSFTHNTWLNDASNICFTTDEKDEAFVYAWDITNPQNIQYKDKIRGTQSQGLSIPHNLHVLNDYGVTSYYRDGVVIFDVSKPENMVEVGYYDTSPTMSGGGFNGAWGVYPYLPSGLIIVSDIEGGLFVLNANYVRGCYLQGLVTDASTAQPINGATVTITFPNFADEFSNTTGMYYAGVATAGTYSVTYSKPGYYPQTVSVSLSNGNTTVKDIQLVPIPTVAYQLYVLQSNYPYDPIDNANVVITDNNGLTYNLTTNTQGSVTQNLVAGQYDVVAGKWSHVTNLKGININAAMLDTLYLDQGYYDDFYFDYGWLQSGAAPRGKWEKGIPVATEDNTGATANPGADVTNDIGLEAYVTGNGGGNIGDDDVDNGATILLSPLMDLTDYDKPVITYYWWMYNKDLANQGPINDHYKLELVTPGQTILVKDYTGMHNMWKYDTIDVKTYLSNPSSVRLKLTAEDANPGHVLEAGFDKLFVKGAPNKNTVSLNPSTDRGIVVSCYPNPMGERAFVRYENPQGVADLHFSLYDLQGRLLYETALVEAAGVLSLPLSLPAGVYVAKVSAAGNWLQSMKWVRE